MMQKSVLKMLSRIVYSQHLVDLNRLNQRREARKTACKCVQVLFDLEKGSSAVFVFQSKLTCKTEELIFYTKATFLNQ